jgi:hypothetical protein
LDMAACPAPAPPAAAWLYALLGSVCGLPASDGCGLQELGHCAFHLLCHAHSPRTRAAAPCVAPPGSSSLPSARLMHATGQTLTSTLSRARRQAARWTAHDAPRLLRRPLRLCAAPVPAAGATSGAAPAGAAAAICTGWLVTKRRSLLRTEEGQACAAQAMHTARAECHDHPRWARLTAAASNPGLCIPQAGAGAMAPRPPALTCGNMTSKLYWSLKCGCASAACRFAMLAVMRASTSSMALRNGSGRGEG